MAKRHFIERQVQQSDKMFLYSTCSKVKTITGFVVTLSDNREINRYFNQQPTLELAPKFYYKRKGE